jgi:hypothetical protein
MQLFVNKSTLATAHHYILKLAQLKLLNFFFRHKDLLTASDLLQLFFDLFKCQDKTLRSFLKDHIVTDLKNTNAKHKDVKLNTTMQNFMFKMINDAHHVAAKMALTIMIDLYRVSDFLA